MFTVKRLIASIYNYIIIIYSISDLNILCHFSILLSDVFI